MDDAGWLSSLGVLEKLYTRWRRATGGLPCRCWFCGDASLGVAICAGCFGDLPRRHSVEMRRLPSAVDLAVVPFLYEYPIRELLMRSKFGSDLPGLKLAGQLLTIEVSAHLHKIDGVVPVPLSALRFLYRGYNQAVEIAAPLASLLGKPMIGNAVRRRRHGGPNSRLSAGQRRRNVRGAFMCASAFDGQTVLIVDDVITTGATVGELARILRRSGAVEVVVAALAAAPPAP